MRRFQSSFFISLGRFGNKVNANTTYMGVHMKHLFHWKYFWKFENSDEDILKWSPNFDCSVIRYYSSAVQGPLQGSSQIISRIFFKRFPRRSRRFEMPYGPNLYTIWVFRKPKIRLVFPEHFHIFGCHVTAPNISIGDVIHGVHHQNLLKFHSIWGLCQPTSWNMAHMKFLQK